MSWIDTGTYDSLIEASKYFQHLENKTGKKVDEGEIIDMVGGAIGIIAGTERYSKSTLEK